MSGLLQFFGVVFVVLGVAAGGYSAVVGVQSGVNLLLVYGVGYLLTGAAFAALFFGLAEVLERLPKPRP